MKRLGCQCKITCEYVAQVSCPIRTNPVYTTGAEELLYEIVSTLVLGFLIGLTGALAPGPTLVATINASLAGNWTAGLKVSLGHIMIETAIFFLIILGLAAVASPYTTAIAVIGGIALIIFGIMTISRQQERKPQHGTGKGRGQPVHGRAPDQRGQSLLLDLVALGRERPPDLSRLRAGSSSLSSS